MFNLLIETVYSMKTKRTEYKLLKQINLSYTAII